MQNKFILLVEDDPDDVVLISRAVRKNSIWADIEVAGDGVEALDFLSGTGRYCARDTDELPGVVLLDVKLPRTSGFEVLRGYSLRADGYVCKSANFEKLVNAIGHLGLDALLSEESVHQSKARAWE